MNKIYLIIFIAILGNAVYAQKSSNTEKIANKAQQAEKMIVFLQKTKYFDSTKLAKIGQEAIELANDVQNPELAGKLLTKTGIVHIKNEYPKQAFEYFDIAMKYIKESKNDTLLVRLLNSMAIGFSHQHKKTKAITTYHKAFDIAQKINDLRYMDVITSNLGILYHEIQEYEYAVQHFKKSLKYVEELNDSLDKAIVLHDLALVYLEDEYKELDTALMYLKKSMKISEKIDDEEGVARSCVAIGSAYLQKKQYATARKYLFTAKKKAKKLPYIELAAQISQNIGILYSKEKNYDSAYVYLNKAVKKSQQIKNWDIAIKICKELSIVAYNEGKYELSCRYKDSCLLYKDSLMKENREQQILDIGAKYETARVQKENQIQKLKIAQQEDKAKLQHAIISSLAAVITLIFVFSIIIYKQLKTKAKINKELAAQHKEILAKNENINQSIAYASSIQKAILGEAKNVVKQLDEAFIYFKPHSVVSGDFYFIKTIEKDNNTYKIIIAADCTGHGVPGAFMTVMGHDLLTEIIINKQIVEPQRILKQLDYGVTNNLKNNAKKIHDGMDIAVLSVNLTKGTATYAGAYNPLCMVRNNQLHIIRGSIASIAGHNLGIVGEKSFEQHEIALQDNDTFYVYSDGFQDQFGGKAHKKYMARRFRELLLHISSYPCDQQREVINKEFKEWKQNKDQTDDVLVIGYKFTSKHA